MITRFHHILWDWNGTLFDDAWLCIEIINAMLVRRRLPSLDQARYQAAFTFPVKHFYRAVGFDFDREPFEVVAAEFMAAYDIRRFECSLQPGAREVLQELDRRGIRQSILSAYEQSRLDEMVAHLGLRAFFQHRVGLDDYYSSGKVESGKRLIAELDCAPADVVLIGDSLHDAEVADAVGIACLLIPRGHYSRARLQSNGNTVLDSLSELLRPA